MNFLNLPLVLFFLFASAGVGFSAGSDEEEWLKNYLDKLKKSSYDKRIAPEGIGGEGSPVKVSSSMFIMDIDKVDDFDMDFTVHFYFRQSWKDPRLQFKDRREPITLRKVEDFWTPDLFFVEERQGSLHQIINPNMFFKIMPDGQVLYSVKVAEKLSCPMDLRSYPHDTQKCQIDIESYGFQRKHISLEWSQKESPPVSHAENIQMLEFDLIDLSTSTDFVSLQSGNYSRLEVHLTFKRRFGFFATRLYVPFILLVVMSMVSLWIRAEEKCLRLSLLLVILYLMITISSNLNDSMPPTSYTKASDVWIGFCQTLVCAAFLEFIFVALIVSKDADEDDSKGKGEILLSLDPEAKDPDLKSESLKTRFTRLTHMFATIKGGNGRRNASAYRIDKMCRIVFPILFIFFNIVYWSVYCCA